MITKGKILSISKPQEDGNCIITLSADINSNELQELMNVDTSIEIKKYRRQRSKNANALLWECLDEIASYLNSSKQAVYLQMLKRYGQWTSIDVEAKAFEEFKTHWKDYEEVGRYSIDGKEMVNVLCYYGSSTYDTKEFHKLLSGTLSEAKEMGFVPRCEIEIQALLKSFEKDEIECPCTATTEYEPVHIKQKEVLNKNYFNFKFG